MTEVKDIAIEVRLRKTFNNMILHDSEYEELTKTSNVIELSPESLLYDKLMNTIDLNDFDDIEIYVDDYDNINSED